jgi:hypothetical protein
MTTNIRTLIKAGCTAAAILSIGFMAIQSADAASARRQPNGAIRFYDDYGQDRGYAWCLNSGASGLGAAVCDYYTLDQCRGSGYGGTGDCVPNPWSYYVIDPRTKQTWHDELVQSWNN